MSSIQMNSEELYKKCCVYLLWTEIAFRYKQAGFIKKFTKRKSWFTWKEYSYKNSYEFIEKRIKEGPYSVIHLPYVYKESSKLRRKVYDLMLLCKNGNPVTVTTDTYVLNVIKQVHEYHPITKIYTGGQTGVDLAGSKAGYHLVIDTEVTLPKGYIMRFEDGKDVSCSKEFVEGLIKGE